MAKIYGQANRVIVWLGKMIENSDLALEAIRLAADKKPINSSNKEMIQQAILKLLQRPWFERIWVRQQTPITSAQITEKLMQVLQEVAAARNILIVCDSTEIDGYAFCLGVDLLQSFYETHQGLQNLIRLVAYLIKGAIFRPQYVISRSGRESLGICSLGKLMDMYHTHKAKEDHDKVYALLGMSSDNLTKAGLLPDYNVSWKELLQHLAEFLLPENTSVETWDDKEIVVIESKGCVLGTVLEQGQYCFG